MKVLAAAGADGEAGRKAEQAVLVLYDVGCVLLIYLVVSVGAGGGIGLHRRGAVRTAWAPEGQF